MAAQRRGRSLPSHPGYVRGGGLCLGLSLSFKLGNGRAQQTFCNALGVGSIRYRATDELQIQVAQIRQGLLLRF